MLTVGLIGYGYWGPILARVLSNAQRIRLAAIADERADRLLAAVSTYPNVVPYRSGSTLIANDQLDAVVVATPLSSHYALSMAAIQQGKHVLVEKPMTASLDEAQELGELAVAHDVRLMVDHTAVYDSAVRVMRSAIDANELGSLLYLDSVRANLGLFRPDANVMWDLAPHDMAMMDYLVDERPAAISVHGARFPGRTREHMAHITVHFSETFLAHFHVNWLAPVKMRRILMCGCQRMLLCDDLNGRERVRVYDAGIDVEPSGNDTQRFGAISYRAGGYYAPQLSDMEPLAAMVREFADAINQRRSPLTDAAAGIRVVAMLEAGERSLRANGMRIPL